MNDQTSESWDSRLGWAFDLIADDPEVRARAHERLATAAKARSEALAVFNHVWMVSERGNWTAAVTAASARYLAARRDLLPDALWEYVSAADLRTWPGLPYALLYLEWEVRFPDEWMAHGKSWGTKQGELRNLALGAPSLPAFAQHKLVDLIGLVVQRKHRIWDVEYARLARALPAGLVRARLAPLAKSADFTTRSRTGYLLWLLDHPELAHPKPSQWRAWLATSITLPTCRSCGARGMPILYGRPTPQARRAAEQGSLVLAGCFEPDDAPRWSCPDLHRWPGDHQLWQAAIQLAIERTAGAAAADRQKAGT